MAKEKNKKYIIDNPTLMAEWDWEKNADISPAQLTLFNHKKVWWKCQKGHEWQSTIANRNYGTGCPYCSSKRILQGYNDLQTINPTLASEWNYEKNGDLTPTNISPNSNKSVWWKCQKGHEWQTMVYNRSNGCGCPICKSERHTSFPEYAIIFYLKKYGIDAIHSYKSNGYELDIYIPSKKIAIEYDGYFWHKNREKTDLAKNAKCNNDGITLFRIRAGLPSLNDSSIDYIIKENQKDLHIALKKILNAITHLSVDINLERDSIEIENLREYAEKENSLLFSNPFLASQWNYEKNGKLKPEHFLTGSAKKVWWICQNNHEWNATIVSRNMGNGCPYCSNQKLLQGYNDLQTVNPVLAKEWNYEKNGELTPSNTLSNSHKNVWWICSKGHEWKTSVNHRNSGTGCPYCSGLYVIKGETDLQTVNPTLANEWNYEKNNDLTPFDVSSQSEKKVWWKCSKGHEWQSTVNHRSNGRGCPYCSGRKVLKGYNDLATTNPALADEWNYAKNNNLTPDQVTAGSNKKAWWICKKGHEWEAKINNRNNGRNCPYCSGNKVLKNYNDLQTINPTVASEWNYEKNNGLTPIDVTPNSDKKVWWKCTKGHEWQSTIANRNSGTNCPYCSNRKVLQGYNDLQTVNPDLAIEWDYEKNDVLTPFDVLPNSHNKVWWKCSREHNWQATIADRNAGRGCPYCSGRYAIKGENDLQTVNPILAKEWNYEKNIGLTPFDVLPNSHKNVWWKCRNNHEWQSIIRDRYKGNGCPECAKQKTQIT